ncbi:hypothetical protein A2572_01475 [Candidatus Collierbacteria bacterium RIFOXYD1_FULL_40_9]|uniref:AB hydrolase-1 domain-containing protein n=1 Tax=Candidatus Collierbacteria bacterium RIFOXYD1_FULL_40_9 TaxID=1817731 RepID=A0A1F5FVQ8_9BACT|nr:MAG: hypothetical protein A2572_01475 [Candidatus Collierbacteria bacterium RIFOXYD1_FULL_40_9]
MKRALSLCFVLLVVIFCIRPEVYAAEYFFDDFDEIDQNYWQVYLNNGSVSSTNGSLFVSSQPSTSFPYIHNSFGIFPETDYKVTFSLKISGSLNYGSGVILSDKIIANSTQVDLGAQDVIFQVWPESQSVYSLWTSLCLTSDLSCNPSYKKIYSFAINTTHKIEINAKDQIYSVLVDDVTIPQTYKKQRQISYFWVGNPQLTNTTTTRPSIQVDYIRVESLEEEKDPVVILPGFGGSWDLDAILTNTSGNNWEIPEFVKEYDGIINSLKNTGYKLDEDLFVFAYDWRKPLDLLADDLNSFLITKNIDDKNINFVGHSMGGLVARSYLQKYNNENVSKVITVGSPHKGILDAYGMWEGLTIWDSAWWQKALHLIATEVNRNSGETELQAARRVSPSVKDLLPTWNYLMRDGIPVPVSLMLWKNDYLIDKNNQLLTIGERVASGHSSDYLTKSELMVTKPTKEDILKGLWQDGSPIKDNPFLFSVGDGYVTNSSAAELFDKGIPMIGNHGEVISKRENVIKILEDLGIATEFAVGSNHDDRKKLAIFKLNSPGVLEVCQLSVCNENLGIVFADKKMIMVPGFMGAFDIKVKSTGETGNYQLLVGQIYETAEWNKSNGKLTNSGQVDSYFYNSGNNSLTMDSATNNRNIFLYYPEGVEIKNINKIRQDILRQIDTSIALGDIYGFDLLVDKWVALHNYVASLESEKIAGINHKDWGEKNNGFARSVFVSKTPDYFTERLAKIYTNLKNNYPSNPENFYKLDKRAQLLMLKSFLGL